MGQAHCVPVTTLTRKALRAKINPFPMRNVGCGSGAGVISTNRQHGAIHMITFAWFARWSFDD
eukprot:scaffold6351_cov166-Amphora_coffeaeformis.AAC.3